MKGQGTLAAAAVFAGMLFGAAAGANAAPITMQTFDSDPVLSGSQAPGTWYTDRFAPAGFESEVFKGDARLAHTVVDSDGADSRSGSFSSAFYNTQGRKYDTPGATELSIDFYMDPAFANEPGRIAGLWGTGFDAGGAVSAYPIIEFFDNQFQVYDTIGGDSDGVGFRAAGTPTGFSFDTFVNLTIALDTANDLFNYFVSGELLHTEEAGGTLTLGNAILQNINTDEGVNRTVYWDNFSASAPAPVPVPAALPLLASVLAGLGLLGWRRNRVA